MLADSPAGSLRFENVAAAAENAQEAGRLLALALAHWTASHPSLRIIQLDVLPLTAGGNSAAGTIAATAMITYVEPALDGAAAAQAVAAAVEEIHEAQVLQAPDAEPGGSV